MVAKAAPLSLRDVLLSLEGPVGLAQLLVRGSRKTLDVLEPASQAHGRLLHSFESGPQFVGPGLQFLAAAPPVQPIPIQSGRFRLALFAANQKKTATTAIKRTKIRFWLPLVLPPGPESDSSVATRRRRRRTRCFVISRSAVRVRASAPGERLPDQAVARAADRLGGLDAGSHAGRDLAVVLFLLGQGIASALKKSMMRARVSGVPPTPSR